MEATALPQQLVSPALSKKVSFVEAPGGEEGVCKSSPDGKAATAAVPGADCSELPLSHHTNALFSPERAEGGWTIGAQRSDRMEVPEAAGGGEPLASPSPLPSLGAASGAAYTPASSTWLESARKVNDLQGRLASLEAALKDMESKVGHCGRGRRGRQMPASVRDGRRLGAAGPCSLSRLPALLNILSIPCHALLLETVHPQAVAHLDKSLQEKVLATAAKIVQKRFLADKELDRKLQHQILQAGCGAGSSARTAWSCCWQLLSCTPDCHMACCCHLYP